MNAFAVKFSRTLITVNQKQADAIAEKTMDAYSADRFASWKGCSRMLAKRGFNAREIEAILRSKWMRWAGDASGALDGMVPVHALSTFLNNDRCCNWKELEALVAGTFDGSEVL